MDELAMAVRAATLLGRWTLVARKHAEGCSCCPGLGDVSMEAVEREVLQWLRTRHPVLGWRDGLVGLLRECIERRPCEAPLEGVFGDLASAIDDLERAQSGLAGF